MKIKRDHLESYQFPIEAARAVTRYRLGVGFNYREEDLDNPLRGRVYESDFSQFFGFTLGHIFGEENFYLQLEGPSAGRDETADAERQNQSQAVLGIGTESVLNFNGSVSFTKWLMSQRSPDNADQESQPKWKIESVEYIDTAVKSLGKILSEGSSNVIGLDGKTLDQIEAIAILRALKTAKGDIPAAARIIGIGKSTLYRRLGDYRAKGLKEFEQFQPFGASNPM